MSSVRHSESHIISRGQQGKQKFIRCVWDWTCAFIITFQKNLKTSGQLRRKVSGPLPSNILIEYTHTHWGVHTTICWNMLSQQSDSEGVHQTTRESAREQQRDHYYVYTIAKLAFKCENSRKAIGHIACHLSTVQNYTEKGMIKNDII